MNEEGKKRQTISHLLNAETKPKQFPRFFMASTSPDHTRLDYAIWGVLGNKTNTNSHPNIGSLKTAIEEEEENV